MRPPALGLQFRKREEKMKTKAYFTEKPEPILKLKDKHHIYYNIEPHVTEDYEGFQADMIEVKYVDYDSIVNELIRIKYTASNEFAIQRQKEEKPEQFDEYFNYCEQCKQIAQNILEP